MKNIIPALVSVSLLAAVGTAVADGSNMDSHSMGGKTFDSLDTNRDGFVSRDEDPNGKIFNRDSAASADTNKDGKLSKQEYESYAKSNKDWNGSGGMNSGGTSTN